MDGGLFNLIKSAGSLAWGTRKEVVGTETDTEKWANRGSLLGNIMGLPSTILGMAGINTGAGAVGGAAAAGAAGTAGSILAAGGLGLTAGTLAAKTGDKHGKNGDWFGHDEHTGKERSNFDLVGDTALKADNFVNNLIGGEKGGVRDKIGDVAGTVVGAGSAALGGILSAPLGLASAAGNFLFGD